MEKIIYDLGACRGENLKYYLSKSDKVIALEADPNNCNFIKKKFDEEISKWKIILDNCIIGVDENINFATYYIHKTNYLLSQFPKPHEDKINNFDKINLPHKNITKIFDLYGPPYYIKIDLEEYDTEILEKILKNKIKFKYISAEIKDLANFKLFSKFGNYNSFKIVNGHNVEFVYKNFSPNSAGPFGNDIKGNWISYENFLEFLKFRINNDGWFDVHCSINDECEKTTNKKKIHHKRENF